MKDLIYSAYGMKKTNNTVYLNYDLIATVLSIISYSLVVTSKFEKLGFIIGLIASIILMLIMLERKNNSLASLYIFFVFANLFAIISK